MVDQNTKPRKADYEVGYAKPPREHQFRPGQSGNPRGRPKGSKNISTLFEQALTAKQPVREGGKVRRRQNIEILIQQLVLKALKGDPRAADKVLDYCERYGVLARTDDPNQAAFPEDDRALLADFLTRHRPPDAEGGS